MLMHFYLVHIFSGGLKVTLRLSYSSSHNRLTISKILVIWFDLVISNCEIAEPVENDNKSVLQI